MDVPGLRVTVVDDAQALAALTADWNALAGEIPFRRAEWAQTWWRHYGDARSELFTLVVRDERGAAVGIAPWYIHHSPRGGRVVRFLGSGEICSDYLTLLCAPESRDAVTARIAQWLASEAGEHWHLLDLNGIDAEDETMLRLGEALARAGRTARRQEIESCWRTELPQDWNALLSHFSKARRTRTRALLRNTIEHGRANQHRVETAQELERAFAILIDLHQRRRNSIGEIGCFASPRFTAFHREIAGTLLAGGRLALSWLELDGRPAAVDYAFLGGDTVYYYQGGFDPDLASENPGTLKIACSVKWAIESGYRTYDFLRGDESYKQSWQATPRPLVRLRVVGPQASARVRDATHRGAEALKSLAKRILVRSRG